MALLAGLILALPAYAAQKVGVAAAVNPDAFASGRVVNLGKSIFFNEQVKTSTNGLVQVLLVDGSTFTVGPNSNLVIDKFVYDPARGQSEMVATFSKGALRFVGGKLSKKQGGVTVKTPEGALAIRGGIAQIQVSAGGSKFLFDFGDQMQLQGNDGQTHTIFQPGNLIDVTGGSPFVRPTSAADTQYFLTQLASKPGQSGGAGAGGGPSDGQTEAGMGGQGAGGNTPPPVGNEIENQIFTVKIDDATSDEIQQQIVEQIDNQPPPGNDPPPPPPGPPQVQLRVLSSPEVFTSFTETSDEREFNDDWDSDGQSPGDAGILGGDDFNPEGGAGTVTSDDFVTTATIVNGVLTGSVQFVAREYEYGDCSECGYTTVLEPVKAFAFSFSSTPGIHAAFGAVVEGVDELQHVENFVGSQVVANGFFAYQMYGLDTWEGDGQNFSEIDFDDPLLIASGQEYVLPTQGKLHSIELLTDPRQNQIEPPIDVDGVLVPDIDGFVVPFAVAQSMPKDIIFPDKADANDVLPAVSNLLLLERDSDKPTDESQSVWMQTSFYIGTNGESGEQENFVVLALGGVEERDGFDALVGQRRGGSLIDTCDDGCMDTFSFAGGIATLAGGEGAHLMGADGVNVVVGADSTGDGHEIFVDRPQGGNDDDHQYATYHIGTQDPPAQAVVQAEETYTVKGFATGVWSEYALDESGTSSGDPVLTSLGNPEPDTYSNEPGNVTDSVAITFNPERNTLSAVFDLRTEDQVDASFAFGDPSVESSGRSAYIGDRRYGAIETSDGTSLANGNLEVQRVESYLVSGDQLGVTEYLKKESNDPYDPTKAVFEYTEADANGVTRRPFCQNCDFIKWGAWGSRLKADQVEGEGGADVNIHLGWWVAGDVTPAGDLPTQGGASYAGNAIGTVVNGGDQYVAGGDLAVSWNFAERAGQLDIRNFDGRDFGGAISQPNPAVNGFNGAIAGGDLSGSARGAFVNNSAGDPARGVIGDFLVDNEEGYRATGIFAGSGMPGAQ